MTPQAPAPVADAVAAHGPALALDIVVLGILGVWVLLVIPLLMAAAAFGLSDLRGESQTARPGRPVAR